MKSIISHGVNLERSSYTHDSARQIASDNIKRGLRNMVDERILIFDKYIICSQIQMWWNNIIEARKLSFDDFHNWVKNKLNEERSKHKRTFVSYNYNGVELTHLVKLLDEVVENNYEYYECILPEADIKPDKKTIIYGTDIQKNN